MRHPGTFLLLEFPYVVVMNKVGKVCLTLTRLRRVTVFFLPLFFPTNSFTSLRTLLCLRTVSGYKCWPVLRPPSRPRWSALKLLNVSPQGKPVAPWVRDGLTWRGRNNLESICSIERCRLFAVPYANAVSFSRQGGMHSGSGKEGKFNSLLPTSRLPLAGTFRV